MTGKEKTAFEGLFGFTELEQLKHKRKPMKLLTRERPIGGVLYGCDLILGKREREQKEPMCE